MPGRRRGDSNEVRDGVITALAARRGQPDRIGVHLDGRYAFDLSAVVAERAGLRAGDPLTADRQRELAREDAPYRARERALRYLSARDRSRREVELRLCQAGFEPGVVADTTAWLSGLGYVDDKRFAAVYAAEKHRIGWGARRIRAELARKGVGRAVIDEALELQEGADSQGSAGDDSALEQMARKRFAGQFASDPDSAERRLAGFLARRGYDWDTIGRIARTLRAETSAAPSAAVPSPGGRPSSSVP